MHRFGAGIALDRDPEAAASAAAADAAAALDGARADLVFVFVAGAYGADAVRIGPLVHDHLAPRALVGAVGVSGVLGCGREVEDEPAVSVLAASLPDVDLTAFHTLADLGGLPAVPDGSLLVVLTDPYTFDIADLVTRLGTTAAAVGGLAGGGGAGQARLFRDGGVLRAGAVGIVLPASVARPLVSQGCRPVGPDLVVTAASGNALLELAGVPALTKLRDIVASLPPADQSLVRNGLLAGLVIDENRPDYGVGDYLVRVLLGADAERGALIVGDVPRVGQTFRFHVRDEASAASELQQVLTSAGGGGAALVFSCNGRGSRLFTAPDHDAAMVERLLGVPSAGLFCQGEIGPVGGRNHVHGFTATLALLN